MDRIEKIRSLCKEGAAIITTPVARRYLTGLPSSAGILIITPLSAYFIIDFRYIEVARRTITSAEVMLQESSAEGYFKQINDILKRDGAKKATFENEMSIADFERFSARLSVKSDAAPWLSDALRMMRRIKTADEMTALRHAQKITDDAFSHILNFITAGMTEVEIAIELESYMRKNGAEGVSFETICVAGKKSSMPHGVPGDYPVNPGDLLTMDFGAKYDGYCADMTRTVAIGDVSSEQKHVYETVLAAQTAALAAAKAGITGKELDAVARNIIYGAGFEGCFGHGLGHSLGLEVHESPRASSGDDTVLETGMMMTIEPGIYLPGKFGVRIEDMVMITADGCDDLAHSDKRLIIL